jgi:5-methylcytosine-specific restriction endonuclease McrA
VAGSPRSLTPGERRLTLLLARDGPTCHYCGVKIAVNPNFVEQFRGHVRSASSDHVIACSAGGNNALDNLVAACLFCNGDRGAMEYAEYRGRRGLEPRPEVLSRALAAQGRKDTVG